MAIDKVLLIVGKGRGDKYEYLYFLAICILYPWQKEPLGSWDPT